MARVSAAASGATDSSVFLQMEIVKTKGRTAQQKNQAANKTLGGAVLGYPWEPEEGLIKIKMKVNLSKKKHGTKTGPDLTAEECL